MNQQQTRDVEQTLGAAKGLYLVLAEKLGEQAATPHIEAIDRAVAKAIMEMLEVQDASASE